MKKQILKNLKIIISVLLILTTSSVTLDAQNEDYKLSEVVVLSRHNIRAPLSTKGSVLDSATPHTWYEWSSAASELSLRGGILETAMGQYFRKWLVDEELIPENYRPENNEVRFYANAKQRTIATAQYFSSGFLPVANVEIETNQEYDKMDPVFTPQLTFVSDEYIQDATAQMYKLIPDLSNEYALLEDVLDMKESDAYKNKEITDLVNGDVTFKMELNAEPGMTGSLKTGTSLADALVLQYYEEEDEYKAAFENNLTFEQWKSISYIKDVYGDVLFTAPLVSVNVAHPLLQEIYSELNNDERLFTFLCGHDSNVGSVLAALDVKDYNLPEAIEAKTPIGCKLVFEKYQKGNSEYIKVCLIYNSVDDLRNISIHNLDNPPVIYEFEFNGLTKNSDGYYEAKDFYNQLTKAIKAYDDIVNKYGDQSIPVTGIN